MDLSARHKKNEPGPEISHLNLLLELLFCSGGFSVAHGPEAHMKTEVGHSSPAPGYLCNRSRIKRTAEQHTPTHSIKGNKICTQIQIGSPDPILEQALRLFTDSCKGAATARFNWYSRINTQTRLNARKRKQTLHKCLLLAADLFPNSFKITQIRLLPGLMYMSSMLEFTV